MANIITSSTKVGVPIFVYSFRDYICLTNKYSTNFLRLKYWKLYISSNWQQLRLCFFKGIINVFVSPTHVRHAVTAMSIGTVDTQWASRCLRQLPTDFISCWTNDHAVSKPLMRLGEKAQKQLVPSSAPSTKLRRRNTEQVHFLGGRKQDSVGIRLWNAISKTSGMTVGLNYIDYLSKTLLLHRSRQQYNKFKMLQQ